MNGWAVAIPHQHQEQREWYYNVALGRLDFPTWYDYKFNQLHRPNYIPMLWELALNEHFDWAVEAAESDIRPNPIWLMGNEVDRAKPQGTDVAPDVAAATMRAWLTAVDTRVAAPGVVLDVRGLAWFDAYVAAGGPLPDILTVHLYVSMPDDFRRRWDHLREWMHLRDLNMPVWITELGCTRDGVAAQRDVMEAAAYLLATDELLEHVAWFSAHYGTYQREFTKMDLLDAAGNVTAVGHAWLETRNGLMTAQAGDDTVWLPGVSA